MLDPPISFYGGEVGKLSDFISKVLFNLEFRPSVGILPAIWLKVGLCSESKA
jgi:hypothetical protein